MAITKCDYKSPLNLKPYKLIYFDFSSFPVFLREDKLAHVSIHQDANAELRLGFCFICFRFDLFH